MINESTYRSPKFLRNFIDFEINTGSDIKGEPSKKQLKKLEKEKQEKLIKKWKERWQKVDQSLFIEFYEKTFPSEKIVFRSDLDNVYKKWVGNFHFWNLYDKWEEERGRKKKEEEEEKKEQERLIRELNTLYENILNDFRSNPYIDKYSTPTENGKVTFHYKFENGEVFILRDNQIIYETKESNYKYTVGLTFKNKFVNLANSIVNNGRPRSGRSKSSSNSNSSKSKEENKYTSHPKSSLYQRLKETIELRKSQLSKMSKNNPDRKILENELEAAQKAFDNLKLKYKFENLKNFYNFKY